VLRGRLASNRIGSPRLSSRNRLVAFVDAIDCLDGIVCVLEYKMAFPPPILDRPFGTHWLAPQPPPLPMLDRRQEPVILATIDSELG
jgi:hypothetical protein